MTADVASWPVEQVVTIVVVSVLLNKLRSALCAGERENMTGLSPIWF